jgi:hypothetical protein
MIRFCMQWLRSPKRLRILIPLVTTIIYESKPGAKRFAIGYRQTFKL